jgi:hypothetical protein
LSFKKAFDTNSEFKVQSAGYGSPQSVKPKDEPTGLKNQKSG